MSLPYTITNNQTAGQHPANLMVTITHADGTHSNKEVAPGASLSLTADFNGDVVTVRADSNT